MTTTARTCRVRSCLECPERCAELSIIPDEELVEMSRNKRVLRFPAGDLVFRQGDECEGIHAISSGAVGLRKANRRGQSVITRLIHAGQLLGYRTFFAGGTYAASAVAVTDVEVCLFSAEAIDHALRTCPTLARRLLRRLARDLRAAEEEKLAVAAVPVRGRLVQLLLDLGDRYGVPSRDGLVFRLPLARQEMAALIGVRPESVARALRELRDDELISVRGRQVELLNVEALVGEVS